MPSWSASHDFRAYGSKAYNSLWIIRGPMDLHAIDACIIDGDAVIVGDLARVATFAVGELFRHVRK